MSSKAMLFDFWCAGQLDGDSMQMQPSSVEAVVLVLSVTFALAGLPIHLVWKSVY